MELRHLRYFLVAGREQNFIRAAKILSIAQPALSRQIQALEQQLGVALFERLRRGVRLTPAGRVFLEDANRILDEVKHAGLRAQRVANGQIGTLNIGLNEIAIAYPVVAESLRRYRSKHQDVELHLETQMSPELLDCILKESLDVGFVNAFPETHPQISFELLESDTLMLAVPGKHPLAKRSTLRLDDLKGCDFIAVSDQRYGWAMDQVMAACWSRGVLPHVLQEVDDRDVQIGLISAGLGVGFVHATQRFTQVRNVSVKPIEDLGIEFSHYLAWRRENRSPMVQSFVENVLAVSRELRESNPGSTRVTAPASCKGKSPSASSRSKP